jgi:hypothetical protein
MDNICNEENIGYLIIAQATFHITSKVLKKKALIEKLHIYLEALLDFYNH